MCECVSLQRDETVKRMLETFYMSIRKRSSIVEKSTKTILAGVKDKRDEK